MKQVFLPKMATHIIPAMKMWFPIKTKETCFLFKLNLKNPSLCCADPK